MTPDPVRIVRFLALAAWAAMFNYLLLSGETLRFIGQRTEWVVPFGAVTLTLAAIGYGLSLRSDAPPERVTVGEIAGLIALVAPVLAVVMVPSPTLGALAVNRKSASAAASSGRIPKACGDDTDIYAIAAASFAPDTLSDLRLKAGQRVMLYGVASDTGKGGGRFRVSRFAANCCAADALAYTVEVRLLKGGKSVPKDDNWVRAYGALRRLGKDKTPAFEVVVDRWELAPETDELGSL